MTTSTTNLTPASPADNIFLPSSRASGRVIQGRTRATQCGFFAGGCFEPYLRISSALGTAVALSSVAVEHVWHSGTVRQTRRRGVKPARKPIRKSTPVEGFMLRYAVIFFIIAIIAAFFGFGGIASGATEIAKILFFIFIVIFLATLLLGVFRR
jgi:uncharacterized membrane protein YtjA (UPF0391 family)